MFYIGRGEVEWVLGLLLCGIVGTGFMGGCFATDIFSWLKGLVYV